jgi:hypothetical protein
MTGTARIGHGQGSLRIFALLAASIAIACGTSVAVAGEDPIIYDGGGPDDDFVPYPEQMGAPSITEPTEGTAWAVGTEHELTCQAPSDIDTCKDDETVTADDHVTVYWTCSLGEFKIPEQTDPLFPFGHIGEQVTWLAPDSAGAVTIQCYAKDDYEDLAQGREYHDYYIADDGETSDEVGVVVVDLQITSLNPDSDLAIGDDLMVNYRIEPDGFSFDSAEFHVYNAEETLIYKRTGIPVADGDQVTTWDDAKWSEPPNAGAYANPASSDYAVTIIAHKDSQPFESNQETVNTVFVIEADIEDWPQGEATRAAGMADLGDALEVIVKMGATVHPVPDADITLTDIQLGKHLIAESPILNTLADGEWTIQLKDVRDEIGNFNTGPADSDHPEWQISLQ